MESNTFVGLKKLEDFSCEILKSDHEEREEKKCIMNFKIANRSKTDEVKMSISQPGLDVLLDGLHKIQNQLSNVANKSKS